MLMNSLNPGSQDGSHPVICVTYLERTGTVALPGPRHRQRQAARASLPKMSW